MIKHIPWHKNNPLPLPQSNIVCAKVTESPVTLGSTLRGPSNTNTYNPTSMFASLSSSFSSSNLGKRALCLIIRSLMHHLLGNLGITLVENVFFSLQHTIAAVTSSLILFCLIVTNLVALLQICSDGADVAGTWYQ